MLVELCEVQQKPPLDFWASRIRAPHLTFQQLRPLLLMRIDLLDDLNSQIETLNLLKLARNANEWNLHDALFSRFFPTFDQHTTSTHVVFEKSQALWKRHEKSKALDLLNNLLHRLDNSDRPEDISLLQKALFVKSRWLVRIDSESLDVKTLTNSSEIVRRSLSNSKANVFWGWTQLKLYNMKEGNRSQYAINAIKAFVHSQQGLSEMMQLCSIVFRSGKYHNVFDTVRTELESISTDRWLPMIPQLFAQFHNSIDYLEDFAQHTIMRCLIDHHHAVIFPLILCIGLNDKPDNKAQHMLQAFGKMRPDVVECSTIIYNGLLNACTTKAEQWLENMNIAIEYFKTGKLQEMRFSLDKVFNSLKVINSDSDFYFTRTFGDRLSQLQPSIKRFFITKNKKDIDPIWSEYRQLINDIKQDIESMTSIPMRFVAPRLSSLHDIPISVPGTYSPHLPLITMTRFSSSLDVFSSKQRPKRLAIIGSDGNEFWYLLKGHEDLRLDQRVVQVFHLINTFVTGTMPKIVTNFIMPLSTSVGLIQWIQGSDTLFKLIREYRSARSVPLDYESRLISQHTIARYDDLLPIQRMEALERVSEDTSDSVLSDILWLKAGDSESWVKRVTTFSRTSAIMSVIGYILGLGDRHPSNIMIYQPTGSVIHIDFSDCFEVTKARFLFPELIPFRLTRFMVRAFGPCGIDGSFRKTCIDIIRLIRKKRESVMSVLEIFVHAPTVNSFHTQLKQSSKAQTPTTLFGCVSLPTNHYFDVSKTITRISEKINGKDFTSHSRLTQQQQVDALIKSATDLYNLAHLYHGWNPLW